MAKPTYKIIDDSPGSPDIGILLSKLPKTHNWGKVFISKETCTAECVDCGLKLFYSNIFGWQSLRLAYDNIPNCNEYKMQKALE